MLPVDGRGRPCRLRLGPIALPTVTVRREKKPFDAILAPFVEAERFR
jgi:hypothetical protein